MSDETPAPKPRTTRTSKSAVTESAEPAEVDRVDSEAAEPGATAESESAEPAPVELVGAESAEPVAAEPVAPELVEPAETSAAEQAVTEQTVTEPTAEEPAVVAPVETSTIGTAGTAAAATGEVAPAAGSVYAGQQVVYVQTPVPPRPRGNRVIGVLLALVGAVIFAAVYAGVAGLILYFRSAELFGSAFNDFLGTAFFWVPILIFALGFILLVVIVNRGGWAAHVFGSLLLAFAVYFASIGLLLLVGNVFRSADEPVTFTSLATNPLVIASAVVAREVAIWVGLAIAARGRRVKARNVEARSTFDRELAEKKAEYERPAAATA